MKRYNVNKFIKCQCGHCGGILVEGIDIDYYETLWKKGTATAFVQIGPVKKAFYGGYKPTLWERIKAAWSVFRGKEANLYYDDIVLCKEGVQELQQVCTDLVEHWPTPEDLERSKKTLEEFYKENKYELPPIP